MRAFANCSGSDCDYRNFLLLHRLLLLLHTRSGTTPWPTTEVGAKCTTQ